MSHSPIKTPSFQHPCMSSEAGDQEPLLQSSKKEKIEKKEQKTNTIMAAQAQDPFYSVRE